MATQRSRNGKIIVGRMGMDDWEGETANQDGIAGRFEGGPSSERPTLDDDDDRFAGTTLDDEGATAQGKRRRSRAELTAAQRGVAGKGDCAVLPTVPRDAYEIGRLIARGGMGRIYRARDRRLGRPVAIKELMIFQPASIARFEREARITGRLQHPAIVPVYEAGVWPSGEPFYAMKLVAGESLDKVVDRTTTLRERLALVPEIRAVAEALAYAHSHRIVHRDLKPANVLLGEFGETVVIDWGLAKDLAQTRPRPPARADPSDGVPVEMPPAVSGPELTMYGAAMGTPSYMPPEQALGEPVDERADVYALGAILYHVLAGRPAYDEYNDVDEILARVKKEPPRPLAELSPNAPADLLAIADKAMARDPAERYPSARELAEDLKRFETGQLVSVHAYTVTSLLWRWLRRHRGVVAMATIMLMILALLAVLGVDRIRRERNAAERERAKAERQQRRAEGAQARAEARSHELALHNAQAALEEDPTATLAWLAELPADEAKAGTVRLLAVEARSRGIARHVLRGHEGPAHGLAFSAGGGLLASSASDGHVHVWNARTGKRVASNYRGVKRLHIEFAPGARVSEGGPAWLAVADDDGQVMLWDHHSDTRRTLAGHRGPVQYLAFSPDGARLATAAEDRAVWVWDVATGQGRRIATTAVDSVKLSFSGDGRLLIISEDREPRILDARTGEPMALPRGMAARALVMSPDGRWVAGSKPGKVVHLWQVGTRRVSALADLGRTGGHLVFSPDSTALAVADRHVVRLWDLGTRKSRVLAGHSDEITALAFSPDGRLLASGGRDRSVRLWRLEGGEQLALRGHEAWISNLAFSPEGDLLASAGRDGSVRIWATSAGAREFAAHAGAIARLMVSRNDRLVISAGQDQRIRVWDLDQGSVSTLPGFQGPVSALELSHNGAVVAAAGGQEGSIHIWNVGEDINTWSLRDDTRLVLRGHQGVVKHLAISPDGRALVSAAGSGPPLLWDLATRRAQPLDSPHGEIRDLAFSPDGRWIAGADRSDVVLWSRDTGAMRRFVDHEGMVDILVFAPDSKELASGGRDAIVRLWDIETGEPRRFNGHGDAVGTLAFSQGGSRLASGSQDGEIWLWKPRASGAGRKLQGHHLAVGELSFSPDGRLLASASKDSTVRLWDIGKESGRVWGRGLGDSPLVSFSPRGRYLVTGGASGRVVVWPFDAPHESGPLRDWIRDLTTAELDASDGVATP
jgi:eukaryotic-like serine/threonine-protein kinase